MRFRKIGLQGDSVIKGGNGLIRPLQFLQDCAAVVMGIGGLGVQRQGAVQGDERFFMPAKPEQRTAKIAMRCRAAGVYRKGAADAVRPFLMAAQLRGSNTCKMQRIEIARIALQYRQHCGLTSHELPLLQ
jgi:hypothetical protein